MIDWRQAKKWLLDLPHRSLIAVLLVVFIGYLIFGRGGDSEQANGGRGLPVEVSVVESATLAETVSGLGTLRAEEVVGLRPEVAGRIEEIHFDEGGAVTAGQLLFKIEDKKLSHQLSARQAALRASIVRVDNAGRTYERLKQLHEKKLVSDDEFDKARSEFEGAQAERDRLQEEVSITEEQLNDTRIVAPFSGVLSERKVDRGDYVNVGQELATIYKVERLEIAFNIPERYMGQIVDSQPVEITVDAYRDRKFEGKVTFVSPAVDESTRSLLVKATVPNPDRLLKPGSFVNAAVTVDTRYQRPVVPEESLVATRLGYLVYIVEDDVVRVQEVKTGLRQNGLVEVLSGLKVGQKVVRTGHLRLSGGEKISIVERDSAIQ